MVSEYYSIQYKNMASLPSPTQVRHFFLCTTKLVLQSSIEIHDEIKSLDLIDDPFDIYTFIQTFCMVIIWSN